MAGPRVRTIAAACLAVVVDSNAITHRADLAHHGTRNREALTHRPAPRAELIKKRSVGGSTAAKAADTSHRMATTMECQPRSRSPVDGCGRLAQAYGSDDHQMSWPGHVGPRETAFTAS